MAFSLVSLVSLADNHELELLYLSFIVCIIVNSIKMFKDIMFGNALVYFLPILMVAVASVNGENEQLAHHPLLPDDGLQEPLLNFHDLPVKNVAIVGMYLSL